MEEIEMTWPDRLRMWWHRRTHTHYTATKDDLAEIEFCHSRWRRITHAVITFPDAAGLDPVIVHDMGPSKTKFILSGETPLDLRRRAIVVGGEGVKR